MSDDDKVLVLNDTARAYHLTHKSKGYPEVVTLIPGVNKKKLQEWDSVKDTKKARHLIEQDKIQVLGNEGGPRGLPLTRAVSLVAATLDRTILREWKDSDPRKKVQEAIEDQLKLMDGSAPDEKRKMGDPNGGLKGTVGVDVSRPRGSAAKRSTSSSKKASSKKTAKKAGGRKSSRASK